MFIKINNCELPIIESFIADNSNNIYCHNVSSDVRQSKYFDFMCFYLFFIEYEKNNIERYKAILKLLDTCTIGKFIAGFLQNIPNNKLKNYLSVWPQTNIAIAESQLIKNVFKGILDEFGNVRYSLTDIGTGDGVLLKEIIDMFYEKGYPYLKVTAIDQNKDLLSLAMNEILNYKSSLNDLNIVHGNMFEIKYEKYFNNDDIKIINASSVLHELPRRDKITMLEKLKKYSDIIVICELESNHDIECVACIPLLLSTYNFYSALIHDTLESDIDRGMSKNYILNYLIKELFDINTKPYQDRVNYHMTKNQWLDIFRICEFDVKIHEKSISNDKPKINVFVLR